MACWVDVSFVLYSELTATTQSTSRHPLCTFHIALFLSSNFISEAFSRRSTLCCSQDWNTWPKHQTSLENIQSQETKQVDEKNIDLF